jgi:hypothetical protein
MPAYKKNKLTIQGISGMCKGRFGGCPAEKTDDGERASRRPGQACASHKLSAQRMHKGYILSHPFQPLQAVW